MNFSQMFQVCLGVLVLSVQCQYDIPKHTQYHPVIRLEGICLQKMTRPRKF